LSTLLNAAQRDTWLITALVETHSGLMPKINCQEGIVRLSKVHRLQWEIPVVKREAREEAEEMTSSGAIVKTVCKMLGVRREDMLSPKRHHRTTMARQLAMYCCRRLTELSTTQCGLIFGRHHSTVLHDVRRIEKLRGTNKDFDARVARILRACRIACTALNLEELP
jgi:chromosomal replication initiation ATPase DnaA